MTYEKFVLEPLNSVQITDLPYKYSAYNFADHPHSGKLVMDTLTPVTTIWRTHSLNRDHTSHIL